MPSYFAHLYFPLFIWRPSFLSVLFSFSILTPLFAYLIFYHSYYFTALPFCIILLSFSCFVAPLPSPLLLFVYACIFPFLYFNVLRPHILLISIFLCLFGARLSFTSFFLFSILTPLFAYLIFYHSYYLTALPFCIILLSFLCFLAPLPSPLLLFVYALLYSHFCNFGASEISLTVSFF